MENKKRFTTYSTLIKAFKNQEGKTEFRPYVIIEGNLTRDVELKTGKASYYVFTSMGTNVSAQEVFARAKGQYDDKTQYNQESFFNLKFFGKTAERLAKIGTKGLNIIVWGNLELDTYKDAKGNEKKSVSIIVENFKPIFKNSKNENETINNPKTQKPVIQEAEIDDEDDEDIPF